MPHLRDLLKKKDKIAADAEAQSKDATGLDIPQFTFIRSTTESEEIIQPPIYPDDDGSARSTNNKKENRRTLGFRTSSNASITKDLTAIVEPGADEKSTPQQLPIRTKDERRLSQRLHLHRRSRSASAEPPSKILPEDLPEAPEAVRAVSSSSSRKSETQDGDREQEAQEQREAQWEKRATILAMNNPLRDAQIQQQQQHRQQQQQTEKNTSEEQGEAQARGRSPSVSDATGDVNIQEAIRLHEAGSLSQSTAMFAQLAQPKGHNNALAQVLYGLALRHGWGVPPEPEKAVHYLSLAASNSASIEEQALASGMKKGGAAKGELVLAIFELANCFRHGWGVKKDAVAARQYYETAANLGDTDAMEEAAWCLLEGFGGAKDKFRAAQYLRLAEQKGGKSIVGNSWIWKDKYDPK